MTSRHAPRPGEVEGIVRAVDRIALGLVALAGAFGIVVGVRRRLH